MRVSLLATLFLVVGSGAFAQADKLFSVQYNTSIPASVTRDYISEGSWRGAALDWKWFTGGGDVLATGFSVGWHVFNQEFRGTQQLDNTTVTGLQKRYINSVPVLVNAFLFMGPWQGPRAYVGGGVGGYYIAQRIHIGVNAFEASNWHFGVAPEVGFQFPLGNILGNFNVKYHHAFKAGESLSGDGTDYAYWGVNAGLVYDW